VGRADCDELPGLSQPRGDALGEAAIEPVVVLFEDLDVRRITALVRGNVHLLATWGLLKGMEEVGPIEAAEAVWQAIVRAGRERARILTDRPAMGYAGSTWKPGT
jgi:hypothetical protein